METKRSVQNAIDLHEIWTPDIDWKVEDISEAASGKVDGKHVIGRVLGQFFARNKASRNGRYYEGDLWDGVLERDETKERLESRTMFGTIGHDETPVTEQQLRDGDVTHIVTRLWAEGDKGMGEALLLDTPAGRNLNTYLRAGSRLCTSSRASGKYVEGRTHDGIPIVDGDSYLFETFDFVIEPGFLEAAPKLVEKLESVEEPIAESQMNKEETSNMSDELVTKIASLSEQLATTVAAKSAVDTKLTDTERQLEAYRRKDGLIGAINKLRISESDLSRLPRILEELKISDFSALIRFVEGINPKDLTAISVGNISESISMLEDFRTKVARTPQEAFAVNKKVKTLVESYRKLGTPEEIAESKAKLDDLTKQMEKLGTPADMAKAMEAACGMLEEYKVIGTPEELRRAINSATRVLEQYRPLGRPAQVQEALTRSLSVVEQLKRLGGIGRIKKVVESWNGLVKKDREEKVSAKSESLSAKFGVPVTTVRRIVEKFGDESEKILSDMAPTHRISNMAERAERTERGSKGKETERPERRTMSMAESYFTQATSKMSR